MAELHKQKDAKYDALFAHALRGGAGVLPVENADAAQQEKETTSVAKEKKRNKEEANHRLKDVQTKWEPYIGILAKGDLKPKTRAFIIQKLSNLCGTDQVMPRVAFCCFFLLMLHRGLQHIHTFAVCACRGPDAGGGCYRKPRVLH